MSDSKSEKSTPKKEKSEHKTKKREPKKDKSDAVKEKANDESKSTEKKPRKSRKKEKVSDTDGSSTGVSQVVSVESKASEKKPRKSRKKEKVPDTDNSSDKESRAADNSKASDVKPKNSKKKEKVLDTDNTSDTESVVASVNGDKAIDEKPKISEKVESFDTDSYSSDDSTQDIPVPEPKSRKEDKEDVGDKKESQKEENDKPKKTGGELWDWHPVVHPKLSADQFPVYFVNKHGDLVQNVQGDLVPMEPLEEEAIVSYSLKVKGDPEERANIRLDEIMMYTFSAEQLDGDKRYAFHKDGDPKNCAWDNLVVCDLSTLQELEIARLEKQHPGTKYNIVRNMDHSSTFNHYLVSDAGLVYSLIERQHLCQRKHELGYEVVSLFPDTDAEQATSKHHIEISVQGITAQSFKDISIGDSYKDDESDSSNQSHDATVPTKPIKQSNESTKDTTPKGNLEESEDAPKNESEQPQASASETITWKTVGVLPWNGRSYSTYEVSNVGSVRRLGSTKLLKISAVDGRCGVVGLSHDTPTSPKRSGVLICRLVANAFVDGYDETKCEVGHLNGDRQDNRAENLEWQAKKPRNARRVVASLVNDPTQQKEFPSMVQADTELSINCSWLKNKHGDDTFTATVTWDGEEQLAIVSVQH